MQKWEYLTLKIKLSGDWDYFFSVEKINGKNTNDDIQEILKQYGEQGWELVTFTEYKNPVFLVVLKRPKE